MSYHAADEAQVHTGVAGGRVRRDVLLAGNEADLIARLHLSGCGERDPGQKKNH